MKPASYLAADDRYSSGSKVALLSALNKFADERGQTLA